MDLTLCNCSKLWNLKEVLVRPTRVFRLLIWTVFQVCLQSTKLSCGSIHAMVVRPLLTYQQFYSYSPFPCLTSHSPLILEKEMRDEKYILVSGCTLFILKCHFTNSHSFNILPSYSMAFAHTHIHTLRIYRQDTQAKAQTQMLINAKSTLTQYTNRICQYP